jgi:hypothetical protein
LGQEFERIGLSGRIGAGFGLAGRHRDALSCGRKSGS